MEPRAYAGVVKGIDVVVNPNSSSLLVRASYRKANKENNIGVWWAFMNDNLSWVKCSPKAAQDLLVLFRIRGDNSEHTLEVTHATVPVLREFFPLAPADSFEFLQYVGLLGYGLCSDVACYARELKRGQHPAVDYHSYSQGYQPLSALGRDAALVAKLDFLGCRGLMVMPSATDASFRVTFIQNRTHSNPGDRHRKYKPWLNKPGR